jgi:hypothetical protein
MAYQFRVRFNLAERVRIQAAAPELRLASAAEDGKAVTLRPSNPNSEFGEAEELVLLGYPYESEYEAETDARRWVVWLKAAFARLKIGANFGGRGPSGVLTNAGLLWLEETHGRRVLNDVHGVTVFEAEPEPLFMKTSVQAARRPSAGDDTCGCSVECRDVEAGAARVRPVLRFILRRICRCALLDVDDIH